MRALFPVASSIAAGAIVAAAAVAWTSAQTPATGGWRTLTGSWSATGQAQTLPTESERSAAVVRLSGAVVLTDDNGARGGFHGDAISFDDGSGMTTGRAVWTASGGDRLFAVLRGEPVGTGRRVVGSFTGGTGRFAGAIGEFDLTWQYVVSAEDGSLQGRTNDIRVRYRLKDRQP